jgi:branched-chain amino acid transport system permease protein
MNFAYGELIMIGGYAMYYTRGWGWLAMAIVTVLVVTGAALLMELVAFRPVRRGTAVTLLITSFAVSYGLQQLGWMTVGKGPQKGVKPFPALTEQYHIGGVLISLLTIITIATTIVLLVVLTFVLQRTSLGMQLRASTEDFGMARLVGVKANRVISAAFGITGLLAGAVALLYVLRSGSIAPDMGQGINALQATLPTTLASHTQMFAFLLVIGILVVAPDGLVGLLRQLRLHLRRRAGARATEVSTPEASA